MPAIYIASLAAYNAGLLVGAWATLDSDDADENLETIEATIATLKAKRPTDEEFVIHDYDDGINLGETSDWKRLAHLGALLERVDPDHVRGIIAAVGQHYLPTDVDEAEEFIRDRFHGEYRSLEDWAWDYHKSLGTELGLLANHIDWESVGRDLSHSYTVVKGGLGILVFNTSI